MWHGLTKLRLHTQATLDHLESLTKEYGHLIRSFCDVTALLIYQAFTQLSTT